MAYYSFKLIHLIAVMLFLGNIVTGLFWMRFAVNTMDLNIINHSIKAIIKLDGYLTVPGVIVITAGGLITAIYGRFPILGTGWILWSIIMFSISGLAFVFRVVPLQKKLYNLTSQKSREIDDFDWIVFKKAYREWDVWGLIALLTPVSAFVMMILKWPQ